MSVLKGVTVTHHKVVDSVKKLISLWASFKT